MLRRCLTLLGAALAAFHVWLFAGQLWSGALADPRLVVSWLVAAGLTGALIGLRRRGESLIRSRRGIAIWVLAALLHGPALATRLDTPTNTPVAEVVVTLSQTIVLVATLGLGLLLAGVPQERRPAFAVTARLAGVPIATLRATTRIVICPRPPPSPLRA